MENLRSSIGEKKGDMHRGDALLPVNNCKIVSIKYMLFFSCPVEYVFLTSAKDRFVFRLFAKNNNE